MTFSAEDFARALDQQNYQFERGSVVTGTVETHESDGAYVDIGGKSAAFLPTKEASLVGCCPRRHRTDWHRAQVFDSARPRC